LVIAWRTSLTSPAVICLSRSANISLTAAYSFERRRPATCGADKYAHLVQAARYGADVTLLGQAVQMLTAGLKLAEYRPEDAIDEVDTRVRFPAEQLIRTRFTGQCIRHTLTGHAAAAAVLVSSAAAGPRAALGAEYVSFQLGAAGGAVMARLLSLLLLITAAAVFPPAPASAETRRIILHQQADYHGSDYEMLRGVGLDECQSACLADPNCRAFTHNTEAQVCFLKSQPGELTSFAGAVAGQVVVDVDPALDAPGAPGFLPSGLVDEARSYRQTIVAGRDREPGDPLETAAAAAQAFNSGDRRAAADLYKKAIARSPDDVATWTGLAQALLGTRPVANDYELARDAVSAALNAYLLTRNEAARAQALALMAKALERLSEFRPALEAFKASLEIEESESVRKAYTALDAGGAFGSSTIPSSPTARALASACSFPSRWWRRAWTTRDFLTLDGAPGTGHGGGGPSRCASAGCEHGERYAWRCGPGFPRRSGKCSSAPSRSTSTSATGRRRARFTGDNFVLPRGGASGLPVVTVNTDGSRARALSRRRTRACPSDRRFDLPAPARRL
jgi:tetratricopeptide (TPR) repeat protein